MIDDKSALVLQHVQYIPRKMHTVFALMCFVVVIHWLIFPYPSGLLHWHCGNVTIAPVPAKQPWWIWINTSCEFIMNDCITTTKQSTTKPCAYFLGYTVYNGLESTGEQTIIWSNTLNPLQWRHDERDDVSNHQPHDCLPNGLFRRRSKKTSKLRITGLCDGNSLVTGEFPAQRASNGEMFPFDDIIMPLYGVATIGNRFPWYAGGIWVSFLQPRLFQLI